MTRPTKPKRKFPNIEAVRDQRTGEHRGWRAAVWVAGKTRRGVTRPDQGQAHTDAIELRKLRDNLGGGDDPDPTLKAGIKRVLATLEVKQRRPATRDWFVHQFEVIKREWPEKTNLRAITRAKVQGWIEKRLKVDKVSPVHQDAAGWRLGRDSR